MLYSYPELIDKFLMRKVQLLDPCSSKKYLHQTIYEIQLDFMILGKIIYYFFLCYLHIFDIKTNKGNIIKS